MRCSERPELWDSVGGLSDEVWPEYSHHGDTASFWAERAGVRLRRIKATVGQSDVIRPDYPVSSLR